MEAPRPLSTRACDMLMCGTVEGLLHGALTAERVAVDLESVSGSMVARWGSLRRVVQGQLVRRAMQGPVVVRAAHRSDW
jgi:hypothetical protein